MRGSRRWGGGGGGADGGDICFCFKNRLLILDCLYVSSSYFLMFVLTVYNKKSFSKKCSSSSISLESQD